MWGPKPPVESRNNRMCPGDSCLGTEGTLVLQEPLPVTAQAPLSTSQAEPGPKVAGDGKTCVQPWKQPLAGNLVGRAVRGLGKRKDRQDSTERCDRQMEGQEKRPRERVLETEAQNCGVKCPHKDGQRQTHWRESRAAESEKFPLHTDL